VIISQSSFGHLLLGFYLSFELCHLAFKSGVYFMMHPLKFIVGFLCVALLSIYPFPAFAQYQYELTPSIAVSEEYNDNINAAETGEVSDYITGLTPGVIFDILTQNTTFDLQYAPTFVFYKNNKQNNTTRHLAILNWDQRLSQYLSFDLTNTYYRSEEPIEYATSVIGVRSNRQTYWRNTGQFNFNILFAPQSTLTFGYYLNFLENEDPTISDGRTQVPSATLAYSFNVHNEVQVRYSYEKTDFFRDAPPSTIVQVFQNDFTGNNSGFRYTYRFNPNTSAYVDYDYADRDFDGPTPNYKVHQISGGFDHAFSPETSLLLSGGYFIQDNEFFGETSDYAYGVRLTRQFQFGDFSIGGTGGWDENFLDAQRFGFTRYSSADAMLDYQMAERLNLNLGGSYRLDRDNLNIEWTTARGNFGLRWTFLQFLTLSLNYSYAARHSDIPGDGFKVNSIMLSFSAGQLYRW
jgi:predicted porin